MFFKALSFSKSLLLLCIFIPFMSHSAVVMTGTRIIYNESNKEKTVQFTNLGDKPYVVDISISEEKHSKIEQNKNEKFITIPPIFKIAPQAGQIIKLIKMTDNLPKDVESVFYFNFSQIPGTTEEQSSQNQLTLLFNSQVKIFYRPKSIENQTFSLNELIFSKENNKIKVENQSPFHIVIKEANLVSGSNKTTLVKSVMISPKSIQIWDNKSKITNNLEEKIELDVINDYGSSQLYTKKIN